MGSKSKRMSFYLLIWFVYFDPILYVLLSVVNVVSVEKPVANKLHQPQNNVESCEFAKWYFYDFVRFVCSIVDEFRRIRNISNTICNRER